MKTPTFLLVLAALATVSPAAVTVAPDSPALQAPEPGTPSAQAIELFRQGRHAEALKAARPLADEGDADALFLLGYASETGTGTDASRDAALEFYRRAAQAGHRESNYRRALILLNSQEAADREQARQALESAVEEDPANAGRMLGEAWLRGLLSEEPDYDQALKWWTTASEAGDSTALLLLARLHDGQFGFPEKKDESKALDFYRKAAEAGNAASYLPLGSRLLNGSEEIRDEAQGREWLQKAIDAEQTAAYLALGDFEENVKRDGEAAREAYTKGAEAGQPDCMLRLAALHYGDLLGEPDEEKAREWLNKAAEAGHPQAHYELAGYHSQQEEKDIPKIYAHLLGAANGGIPAAQNEVGLLYLSGSLGAADTPAAAAWFTRAAKAGHAAARFNLGTLYERGIGVEPNINNAGELYSLAVGQGHPEATAALARLFAGGIGTERNPVRGWALATLAVERGVEDAKAILGELSADLTPELLTEAKKELAKLKGEASEEEAEEKPEEK